MRNVHISCASSVPFSTLQEVAKKIIDAKHNVTFWPRSGGYNKMHLPNADLVVFIVPELAFEYEVDDLPSGVEREVRDALRLGKKIAIAYRTRSGVIQIYKARCFNDQLEGLLGSFGYEVSFEKELTYPHNPQPPSSTDKPSAPVYVKDIGVAVCKYTGVYSHKSRRRLLLMLG